MQEYIIYKYVMNRPETIFDINVTAELLTCKMLNNEISLWFLIKDGEYDFKEIEKRKFIAINTGRKFEFNSTNLNKSWNKLEFIDTVISDNGIVWHVFENVYIGEFGRL
jgi:hypothetical protein